MGSSTPAWEGKFRLIWPRNEMDTLIELLRSMAVRSAGPSIFLAINGALPPLPKRKPRPLRTGAPTTFQLSDATDFLSNRPSALSHFSRSNLTMPYDGFQNGKIPEVIQFSIVLRDTP